MPFSLKLISSPLNFAGEHETVEALFELGLESFHLRKPDFSESAIEKWLLALPAEFRSKVWVHGYPDLAIAFDLAGCHMPLLWLQARHFEESAYSSVKAWNFSAHSFEEIAQAPAKLDSCFLSPIFDSISKIGYRAAWSSEQLSAGFKTLEPLNGRSLVYALGGVELTNLHQVVHFGFDGAALLGAVWNSMNPIETWKDLLTEANTYD